MVYVKMVNSDERMKKNVEYPCNLLVLKPHSFFSPLMSLRSAPYRFILSKIYFPDMKMALPFYPVAKPFLQGKSQGGRSYDNKRGQFTLTLKKNGIC